MAVIAFRLKDARPAVLGLRADSTALAVDEVCVSSYDLCGRPYALVRNGWTFRRALDGRSLQKHSGALRVRRVLDADETAPVVEAARGEARAALDALGDGGLRPETAAEARRRLERIVAMDEAALAADAARFRTVYRPVGMLPPDQYLAVVLQATEGCAWNACTFCGLYRDVPFHAKSEEEFVRHVGKVLDYFGEGIALRRSVFLGDANALCMSHERVDALLEAVGRTFAVAPRVLARWGQEQWERNAPRPARGVNAFVDVWTGARRTVDQWRAHAERGLRRVYVGLESGDEELLAWLDKPFQPEQAIDLVDSLHAAGLAVGVIVLLGAGGGRFDEHHVERTAGVLSRMRLGASDLLYFSEFVPGPGMEYARRAQAPDLRALPAAACAAQRSRILAAVRADAHARHPRTATYDIREFVY